MKIFIAEGHPTTRLGLKGLLLATDMQVVGETDEGEAALKLIDELAPDVVVLGLNLVGETDGITMCRKVKALPCPPRILVHTAYNWTDDVASCLLAGADSYLHKRCDCAGLLDAIRRTARGERVWHTGGRVGDPRTSLSTAPTGVKLTEKEREVVALILRRFSNERIARELYVSLATVKTHVRNVLRKFNVERREQLFEALEDP